MAVAEGLALLGTNSAERPIPEGGSRVGADATGSASHAEGRVQESDRQSEPDGLARSRRGPDRGSRSPAGAGADLRRALELLAGDRDPLVRAAAFKAAGAVGCPPPLDTIAARALATGPDGDAAWQARAGAAQALAAARPQLAVEPLATAAVDPHPEVRKAAVMALASMRAHPAAAAALRVAATDGDADVRAYARQGPMPLSLSRPRRRPAIPPDGNRCSRT